MVVNFSKTQFGALFICVAAILWGLDGVVLTPRLFNLDVSFVVFLIHVIPFLFMAIFLYKEFSHLKEFTKKDYYTFFLIALFGGAIGTLSIVKALFLVNFTHLSVVVLIQKLQPIFAILLAAILLKEKISKSFTIWAGIALFATYLMTFGISLPNFSTGENTVFAALFSLLAAFSFGSATVFGKSVLKKYSFRTATFYRFGFTAVIMFFWVLLTNKLLQFGSVTQTNWIILITIGATTGSGAIFLYYYGLTRVKAIISTIAELSFPLSAILFDYFINGSVLSGIQWVGIIILIGAITKVSMEHSKLTQAGMV